MTSDELIITEPLYSAVGRGQVPALSSVEKFGRNEDVDTGGFEDIWDGGATWVAPTQARVHNVASTSALDTSAGTGARTLDLYGLDADGLLANETVTLAGTANVATAGTYTMVHRMIVRTAGTVLGNAGTITATAQTDATVTAQINPGNNQTLMAIYQMPSNMSGNVVGWYASMNRAVTTGSANMRLLVKPPGEVFQVKRVRGLVGPGKSDFDQKFDFPITVTASSIVKIDGDVSASNTDISAGFAILTD